MAIDATRIHAQLLAWRDDYEAGRIRFPGLRTPTLDVGERPGARRLQVRAVTDVADAGVDVSAFGPHLVAKWDGTAFATSSRLLIAAGRRGARRGGGGTRPRSGSCGPPSG